MITPIIKVLSTYNEIEQHLIWLNSNAPYAVIDTETTSLNIKEARIVDVQISGTNPTEVVIFGGEYAPLLEQLSLPLVFHNAKYDLNVLENNGIAVINPIVDTMLLSHLVDENREHSLESWVVELWEDNYKDEFWSKNSSYHEAAVDERTMYACKDIVYTHKLYVHLQNRLKEQNIPQKLVDHVHALAASLRQTELAGLAIDFDYLTQKGVEVKARLEELMPQMRKAADLECSIVELDLYQKELDKRKTDKGKANVKPSKFSFTSATQLSSLLYQQLELPPQYNEKTKQLSTDWDSLEKIKHMHPVVSLIQEYRDSNKVYGTYIEGTLERMHNGRIYPSFNVNGTATGRISASNPNLQQLPASGGIRGIYIPDPGTVFISADFSSLEVVVEANLTKDKNLKKMLTEGLSKHDLTSKELGVDRKTAKTLNFALQYWCSHMKVAKILQITQDEGKKVYDRYWDIYSGCRDLKAFTDNLVRKNKPIVTMFGRKRRFPAQNYQPWAKEFRQAYNFMIQSPGADITSRAAYLIDQQLRAKGWGKLVLTVHDEILIQVNPNVAEEAEKLLLSTMSGVGYEMGLEIPLSAVGSGPQTRWED
jgi:DNA polymerase-1